MRIARCRRAGAALVLVTGILIVSLAYAAPTASTTVYANRVDFDTAAGATRLIEFDVDDYGLPITNPSAQVWFDYLGLSGVCFQDSSSYYNRALTTFAGAAITVDLPAGTYAFGTHLHPFYNIAGSYTVTLSTGEVFQFPWVTNLDFFGAVSATPIDWVTFSYDNTFLVLENFSLTATAGPGRGCPAPAFIAVDIDIKPGSDPNSINARSPGNIPVAILTTTDYDPLDPISGVDPATVTLAGAAKAHPDDPLGHWKDVDGDGYADLLLHFDTADVFGNPSGLSCGDIEATLAGSTYDGVPIEGSDAVVIVACR